MRAGRIATSMCQFVLFILTWITTFILALIIVPTIHESGHAAACVIQGGAVTHWQPLPFGTEADTGCSAGLTPFLCAAGSLTSIATWLLCTHVFSRHGHGWAQDVCGISRRRSGSGGPSGCSARS